VARSIKLIGSRRPDFASMRYLNLAPKRDEQSMTVILKRALPLTVLKYRRDRLLAQRALERLKGGTRSAASLANDLNF
jgi:hypothetical protein